LFPQGLKDKTLTWDYLTSNNFLHKAFRASVPVYYILLALQWTMEREVKLNLSNLLDNFMEHFWRVRGLPGMMDFDMRIFQMLKRRKIVLPFDMIGE
jgi:hypothetical protein